MTGPPEPEVIQGVFHLSGPAARAVATAVSLQPDRISILSDSTDVSVNQPGQKRGVTMPLRRNVRWKKLLGFGDMFRRLHRFMRRPLKRGVRANAKRWLKELFAQSLSEALFRIAFTLLRVIFIGLIVCTMVDMIPQTLNSGQFWNTIIIILTCAIFLVWSLILYVIRAIDTKRSIKRIPRPYLVNELGVPKRAQKVIDDGHDYCSNIFKKQIDCELIDHPGLSNPKSDITSNGPYVETIESIPLFIEWKIQIVDPRFVRPAGCDFRSYMERAVAHHIIDQDNSGLVEDFLTIYEQARFSGRPLTKEEFKEVMLSMCTIIVAVSRNSQKFGSPPPQIPNFDNWNVQERPRFSQQLDTFSEAGSVLVHSLAGSS